MLSWNFNRAHKKPTNPLSRPRPHKPPKQSKYRQNKIRQGKTTLKHNNNKNKNKNKERKNPKTNKQTKNKTKNPKKTFYCSSLLGIFAFPPLQGKLTRPYYSDCRLFQQYVQNGQQTSNIKRIKYHGILRMKYRPLFVTGTNIWWS